MRLNCSGLPVNSDWSDRAGSGLAAYGIDIDIIHGMAFRASGHAIFVAAVKGIDNPGFFMAMKLDVADTFMFFLPEFERKHSKEKIQKKSG